MSRQLEADQIIKRHVLWAMGAGLIPMPIVDFTAVTAVQTDMLSQLAKLYEVQHSNSSGKLFVAALTGSTFARIGASAIKAIPGIGTVIGGGSMSIMSGASTYAVGKVATQNFEAGGSLLNFDLNKAKKAYSEAYEEGKNVASEKEKDKSKIRDVYGDLEKLGKLREQAFITEEEFQRQKEKLLNLI